MSSSPARQRVTARNPHGKTSPRTRKTPPETTNWTDKGTVRVKGPREGQLGGRGKTAPPGSVSRQSNSKDTLKRKGKHSRMIERSSRQKRRGKQGPKGKILTTGNGGEYCPNSSKSASESRKAYHKHRGGKRVLSGKTSSPKNGLNVRTIEQGVKRA